MDLSSLKKRSDSLRQFLYRNMHSTDAKQLLEEGMPLIDAATDSTTRKTAAYQFLLAAAEKNGVTLTTPFLKNK